MNKTTYFKIECPKCHSPAHARVDKKTYEFLIYKCPICDSNVAYYENKVDILSDEFMQSLLKDQNFKYYGDALVYRVAPSKNNIEEKEITPDRINDFLILLNTEKDYKNFLDKI